MIGGEDLEVEQEQRRQSLAYKEMNITYYYVATLFLFYFEVAGACVLNDIGLIFEFISAIAISALAFIFPGLFYLLAEGKFATSFQKDLNKGTKRWAWFFLISGVLAFVFFMTANILEIVSGHHEEPEPKCK